MFFMLTLVWALCTVVAADASPTSIIVGIAYCTLGAIFQWLLES